VRESHVAGIGIPDHPTFARIPKVVRQVSAKNSVKEIIKRFVAATFAILNFGTEGLLDLAGVLNREYSRAKRKQPGSVDFPLALGLGPGSTGLVFVPRRLVMKVVVSGNSGKHDDLSRVWKYLKEKPLRLLFANLGPC
jgi:hypothetical protein